MRLSKELISAMKAYYVNRDNQEKVKWDKEQDLRNIVIILKKDKRFKQFEACVGHFWICWKTGENENRRVMTEHDENDYWEGKIIGIYHRKSKADKWVKKDLTSKI